MLDFHSHIDLYPNALDVASKTNLRNKFTIAVTTSPRAWMATSKVFHNYQNIKVALGMHPEILGNKYNEIELMLSNIARAKYIGEIGIDGSGQHLKNLKLQEICFEEIIKESCRCGGRLLSIHSRNACSNVIQILFRYPNAGIKILHWFSGNIGELKKAIDMDCYFSVNSAMFKSQKSFHIISRIPQKLILPESDGPFISINGKPVMPWESFDICNSLSSIWSIPVKDTQEILINNYNTLNQLKSINITNPH